MPYFSKLYQTELPHRAKLVYIYLHDRMDKEKKSVAGYQNHSRRFVPVPQYRQTGYKGFGESCPDTKRAALPGKRQCDLQSLLSALEIIFLRQGRSLPVRGPRKVVMTLWGEDEQRSERAFAVLRRNERYAACEDEVNPAPVHRGLP